MLIKCQAGCRTEAVCAAIGLEYKDLFVRRRQSRATRREVAAYDYVDAAGNLLFQTVRYVPKDFRQRRPDGCGGWSWSLAGVQRVLYRLPGLLAADPMAWIIVVEGEKDADTLTNLGLIATTCPMGAGKWAKVDDEPLVGRRVCVVADADGPGRAHAEQVAKALFGRARELKVVELPPPGKDASDWIASGGDSETLQSIVENAPPAPPPSQTVCGRVSESGSLPEEPRCERPLIANVLAELDSGGRPCYIYRSVTEIGAEVQAVLGGWPRRVNGALFVPGAIEGDLPTADAVRLVENCDQLFAVLTEVADVKWHSGAAVATTGRACTAVRRSELFEHLRATTAPNYAAVEVMPHEPPIDNIWYAGCRLPPPTGRALLDFTHHLNAETDGDRGILEALLLTLGWGGPPGTRPAFVITSKHGKGAGKTQTAERVMQVWGGRISVSSEGRIGDVWERLRQRLLSEAGMGCRGVLIDNVKSRIGGADVESFISAPTIDGHALWRGQRSIPNFKTICLTMNAPQLSGDLAPRCVVAHIGPPRHGDDWEGWVNGWLKYNRAQLISDVRARLAGPEMSPISAGNLDRWTTWQRGVLSRVENGNNLAALIRDRRDAVNADADDALEARDAIYEELVARGHSPDVEIVWIRRADMTRILQARGVIDKRATSRWVFAQLVEQLQSGAIPELSDVRPQRDGPRAWQWCGQSAPDGQRGTWLPPNRPGQSSGYPPAPDCMTDFDTPY